VEASFDLRAGTLRLPDMLADGGEGSSAVTGASVTR
jgi:hypothetical protein